MTDKYDAIIVLPYLTLPNGLPSEENQDRLDKAIELFKKGNIDFFIVCGKNDHNSKQPITHAKSMEDYAISKGIPESVILKEEKSVDTVGHPIFIKNEIIKQRNWKKLIVVSSDYHIQRVKKIFDFILGEDFSIDYISSKTNKNTPEIIKKESNSLQVFHNTFKDVNSGDYESILERLYEKHPLYNKKFY
ncbi:MAG: YdcF family protein [Nanoarchaeota archaeon]